jgi:hypothetical protein
LTALQRLSFLASRVAYHRVDPHRLETAVQRRFRKTTRIPPMLLARADEVIE